MAMDMPLEKEKFKLPADEYRKQKRDKLNLIRKDALILSHTRVSGIITPFILECGRAANKIRRQLRQSTRETSRSKGLRGKGLVENISRSHSLFNQNACDYFLYRGRF